MLPFQIAKRRVDIRKERLKSKHKAHTYNTHTYIYIYRVNTHEYIYTHTHIYIYKSIATLTHRNMLYTHTYIHTQHTHIHTYTHIHTHIYIYAHIGWVVAGKSGNGESHTEVLGGSHVWCIATLTHRDMLSRTCL